MRAHGRERVDGTRSKCNARWRHRTGWTLEHCGHPTANTPWVLKTPDGQTILTGVRAGNDPTFGTCWPDLRSAVEWLYVHLSGSRWLGAVC